MNPDFTLLKASAGSGKTHALSVRYLKFVLERNLGEAGAIGPGLQNVLAITFTKNAAREMKERILGWLKDAYFKDATRIVDLVREIRISPQSLPRRAGEAVERILDDYTDFQVETIDSFMASVFKASAVDLGFPPDFEIVLEHGELIDYAFYSYLRTVKAGTTEAVLFRRILGDLQMYAGEKEAFAWDPTAEMLKKMISFYGRLTAQTGDLVIARTAREYARIVKKLSAAADKLETAVEESGLERSGNSTAFTRVVPAIREKRYSDLIGVGFKAAPVKKAKSKDYERVLRIWGRLAEAAQAYAGLYARDFFTPYLDAYQALSATLDRVKRRQGVVFIEDMNRQLARYMEAGIVPDVYFRLGDRIDHYLIDEFQDTSPIQWTNLRPLIEESLSQGGSLFAVGDTKQAIYGFRDADFRIMRRLERGEEEFPSAAAKVEELPNNYRSGQVLLDFVKEIFQIRGPRTEYAESLAQSGLNDFHQEAVEKNRGAGYVEYVLLDKSREEDGEEESAEELEDEKARGEGNMSPAPDDDRPEKARIQDLVADLLRRGYSSGDIGILTFKNETVVDVSAWLNEAGVPLIPFSSLDIRGRKVIGEILALLRFLESPPDDLSLAAFLTGEIFRRAAPGIDPGRIDAFLFEVRRAGVPLYTAFRNRFPEFWDKSLEPLFKAVGYFPLYDLVVSIYRLFDLFRLFPGEEAALARLLEAIKDFEGQGRNDLREFLDYSGAGGGEGWTIDVPTGIDAVKVMTIHKAKGLEFPVVILLLYADGGRAPDFYLDARPGEEGEAGEVRVYKINKKLAESDAELDEIYQAAGLKEEVNRLNMLYVALTRAASELYIVGVKKGKPKFPFDLLGDGFVSAPVKPAVRGRERKIESSPAGTLRPAGPFELPPNPRDSLNFANRRRGELVHKILAGVEFVEAGWEEALEAAAGLMPAGEGGTDSRGTVIRGLARSLENSPVADLFRPRPGRRILREWTFCDGAGQAFRMDRVVVDLDAVHIIDFKTGAEGALLETDREQVRSYIRLVRDVFPDRPVRGLLAFVDRHKWETVE